MTQITPDELVDAIRAAMAAQPETDGTVAVTTLELADKLGLSHEITLRNAKRLQKAGLLRCVMVRRFRCDGAGTKVPGWVPV